MEEKKSTRADLDRRSRQNFMLSIVVVLAALFVALEYDFSVADDSMDPDALDDIVKELDLEKLKEEEQRIPLISKPVAMIPKTIEKLNVVEEEEPSDELNDDELMPDKPDTELKTTEEDEVRPEINKEELDAMDMKVVEQLPEFPGGATALMKWLTKNLRYPSGARARKIQGRVVTQFIVNTDGSLTDLKVVESAEPSLDREALRVLSMMPPWKAGQTDHKPCRTMVCIPIVFKL
jgi:protein TonB